MKIYIWALIVILGLGGLYFYSANKDKIVKMNDGMVCYSDTLENGELKDVYSLNMNIQDGSVTGELNLLPAEKDSKTGSFEGLISSFGQDGISQVVAAWWNASGEGITNREQLAILLSSNSASIGFGEMIENENGDFVYADTEEVSYSLVLPKVDCLNN